MDRMRRLIAVVDWIKRQDSDFHLYGIDASNGNRIYAKARINGKGKDLYFEETDKGTVCLLKAEEL